MIGAVLAVAPIPATAWLSAKAPTIWKMTEAELIYRRAAAQVEKTIFVPPDPLLQAVPWFVALVTISAIGWVVVVVGRDLREVR